MKIGKKKLIDLLYRRLNRELPKQQISDVIDVICEYLTKEIAENRSVTVRNFGTFSPYLFHGHDGWDFQTNKLCYRKPFRSVKFRSHHVFERLISRRKKKIVRSR